MSDPSAPRSGSNSTKEMLDELDALMQRMLELPVSEGESLDAPAAAVPTPPISAPVATQAKKDMPPPAETPRPAPRLEAPTARSQGPVSAPAFVPVAKAEPAPRVHEPPPVRTRKPAAEPPRPPVEKPRVPATPTRPARKPFVSRSVLPPSSFTDEARRPPSWGLATVVWTNQAFDRGTGLLGPLGGWLRGGFGRTLLGGTGVLLLLGAAAWGLYKVLG